MTSTLRAACAAIALSFAAQAGAADLWINSDSTSRDHKLGSVVLLELGTTPGCIICRAAPMPMGGEAVLARRDREPDFYASVIRKRAGEDRDDWMATLPQKTGRSGVDTVDFKGSAQGSSPREVLVPHR